MYIELSSTPRVSITSMPTTTTTTTTPWTMASLLAQEEEMNATLQEALACTTCTLHLTKASMRRDLEAGVYDPLRDPPFSHSHAKACSSEECGDGDDHDSDHFDSDDFASGSRSENQSDSSCYSGEDDDDGQEWDEEGISPLSKPTRKQIPRYARLITPLQRLSYQSCVSDVLGQGRKQGLEPAKLVKSDEEDEDLRFAYYQVDYHIHLHDRARCSMLTICRDIEDVRQLRGWEIEMKQLDEVEAGVYGPDSTTNSAAAAAAAAAATSAENELFTVHQAALWKRRWRLRQRRVNDVRRKWAQIMAERKRQHEELLLERRKMFCAKVKLYTWKEGDKVLLRELRL